MKLSSRPLNTSSQQVDDLSLRSGVQSSPVSPTMLGQINPGLRVSRVGSLASDTDSFFYGFSLPTGTSATITLSNMGAGADFDLVVRHNVAPFSIVVSSTNRGSSDENVTVQSDSSGFLVEVRAITWSAAASNFTLNVSGNSGSGTGAPFEKLKSDRPLKSLPAGSSAIDTPPGVGSNSSAAAPKALGRISPGTLQVSPGSLNSASDSAFYAFSLSAGSRATLTVSGMSAGADFDLIVRHNVPPFSTIISSTNRGNADEMLSCNLILLDSWWKYVP